ncbi:hypothetical protein KA405_01995 [Patescibacteria group bacterium]|nr:hypothetical protein [Patescibacteria group bacterium]
MPDNHQIFHGNASTCVLVVLIVTLVCQPSNVTLSKSSCVKSTGVVVLVSVVYCFLLIQAIIPAEYLLALLSAVFVTIVSETTIGQETRIFSSETSATAGCAVTS